MELTAGSPEDADLAVLSAHPNQHLESVRTYRAVPPDLPHGGEVVVASATPDLSASKSQPKVYSKNKVSLETRRSLQVGQLNAFIDELVACVDHLSRLSNRLPSMTPADAEASCAEAIRTLIARLNRSSDFNFETTSRRSSVRLCVENYVKRNLSSKDITPEVIYRRLEIPRSTLYKAFSELGGVAKYIQDIRLDVARSLIFHPEEHRSLSNIADSLGFKTSAQFSKAYRRRFGMSPRDVRRACSVLPLD